MDLTTILFLAFPSAALAAGAFLLVRGILKLRERPPILSGKASSAVKMREPLRNAPCAYCKVVLESYTGGARPWKALASVERRGEFFVGDIKISPEYTDFRLPPKMSEGYLRKSPGLLEQTVGEPIRMVRGAMRANPFSHEKFEGKLLDEELVSALRSMEPMRKALSGNIRKPVRVTEYILPEGATVFLCGGNRSPSGIKGSLDNRMILSGSGEDDIRSALRDRAAMGIAAGAFLLVLSALLYFLIMLPA